MRLSDYRNLLDTALDLLGDGPGRVSVSDGERRVRIGRASMETTASLVHAEAPVVKAGEVGAAAPEGVMVRAPAIGVVSFRDQRTDKPFVTVGQTLAQGQTVAFITSMEVTTKVIAPRAGVVEEVFVEDGDGVEYNAPLLKMLPT